MVEARLVMGGKPPLGSDIRFLPREGDENGLIIFCRAIVLAAHQITFDFSVAFCQSLEHFSLFYVKMISRFSRIREKAELCPAM